MLHLRQRVGADRHDHQRQKALNETNPKKTHMDKQLTDMSLEELWELFLVFLVPHDDSWRAQYAAAQMLLSQGLAEFDIARISHIGNTAIADIKARGIIDVLMEVGEKAPLKTLRK